MEPSPAARAVPEGVSPKRVLRNRPGTTGSLADLASLLASAASTGACDGSPAPSSESPSAARPPEVTAASPEPVVIVMSEEEHLVVDPAPGLEEADTVAGSATVDGPISDEEATLEEVMTEAAGAETLSAEVLPTEHPLPTAVDLELLYTGDESPAVECLSPDAESFFEVGWTYPGMLPTVAPLDPPPEAVQEEPEVEAPPSQPSDDTTPSPRVPEMYRAALKIQKLRKEGKNELEIARRLKWTIFTVRSYERLLGLHPALVRELFDHRDERGDLAMSTALELTKVPIEVQWQIWTERSGRLTQGAAKRKVIEYLRS